MPATLDRPAVGVSLPPVTPRGEAKSDNIFDRAVCLVLTLRGFSNHRKLTANQFEVKADKAMVRANKSRLVSPELDAINQRDSQMREWLYRHSLPSPLGKGMYMIPIAQIEQVEAALETWCGTPSQGGTGGERGDLIAKFIQAYPDRYEEAQTRLDAVFNALDYPVSAQELRIFPEKDVVLWQEFAASHRYVSFTTPSKLETVDPGLFRREAQKAATEWSEFRSGVTQMLRQEMANLVNDMHDKLTGKTENGKPKVIRKTFLPYVQEWLAVINDRNIVDDAALRAQADRMRELLNGVDDSQLRADADCRATIARGFQEIQQELSTMLTDRPVRAISFGEELV